MFSIWCSYWKDYLATPSSKTSLNTMPSWKINISDLMSLWIDDYPRILGDIWLNGTETQFLTDETFCRTKIQSFCTFTLPAGMPIVIRSGSQYDPFLTPEGLFIDVPAKPASENEIYRNYLMQSRFFELPGAQTISPPAPSDPGTIPVPAFEAAPDASRWMLRVSDIQKIITTLPRLIAMTWLEPAESSIQDVSDVQNLLERNMEVSLVDFFEKGGKVDLVSRTAETPEAYLTEEGLFYPVPERPNDLSEIFESFTAGATNPSTTQSPQYCYP